MAIQSKSCSHTSFVLHLEKKTGKKRNQKKLKEQNDKEVVELALLAGHILLENGAEIFRVEETMERICAHFGVESASEFVLSNGIFVTVGNVRENVFA